VTKLVNTAQNIKTLYELYSTDVTYLHLDTYRIIKKSSNISFLLKLKIVPIVHFVLHCTLLDCGMFCCSIAETSAMFLGRHATKCSSKYWLAGYEIAVLTFLHLTD